MRFWFVGLIVFAVCRGASAQVTLSDQATASLWTVGPGPDLYAAWGHSAVRIQDPVAGIDRIYNYGTFDFNTPNFYPKFIRGNLDYLLSADITPQVFAEYRDLTHQLVIEQTLNFTRAQVERLLVLLEDNLLPENAAYRYDFVRDNCSTRIRDIVAEAAPVKWPVKDEQETIRQILAPYVRDRPLIDNGIDLLFTIKVDRPPASDERFFLPQTMEEGFAGAVIQGTTGSQPLVRKTEILWPGARLPTKSFDWLPWAFWIVAAVGFLGWHLGWSWLRFADVSLFIGAGLVGLLLLFLWIGTRHWVLHANYNLLWAWPTHLVIWFFGRRTRSVYWRVFAATMFLLVPFYFFSPQFLPAFVPPLLLLLGIRSWTRSTI